ncbi:MAG: hypothetical protein WKH64_14185 [Chloroflexia bacterium]
MSVNNSQSNDSEQVVTKFRWLRATTGRLDLNATKGVLLLFGLLLLLYAPFVISQARTQWANQDIGVVGSSGSASHSNGTFTVNASGADIWGTSDSFHFLYQPLSGNAQTTPTPAFLEQSGQVVIEAENYHSRVDRGGQSWAAITSPAGYVGAAALLAQPNSGVTIDTGYTTTSPELQYQVQFATTGTYYVWLRGYADKNADNSLHVGIDGQAVASADRRRFRALGRGRGFRARRTDPLRPSSSQTQVFTRSTCGCAKTAST